MEQVEITGRNDWEVALYRAGLIAGQLAQLNTELVALTAQVIAADAWVGDGIRSPEHWLMLTCALSPARARDVVAVARRHGDFPSLEGRMAAGTVSLDQMAVVARHVPTEYGESVALFVECATVPQLRRVLPKYPFEVPGSPASDDEGRDPSLGPSEQRHIDDRPALQMSSGHDGRFRLRFEANLLDGALVEQALREAKDALFTSGNEESTLADALLEMASRSMGSIAKASRREHYKVLIHLDADGHGWVNKSGALPRHLMDAMTCDGAVRPVWLKKGSPVSVGRSQRIVPARTRRLVEDRDGGCRFPACTTTGFLENHHIEHWSRGGATDIDTVVSLCPHHHREHHRGVFTITGNPNTPGGLRFWGRGRCEIRPHVPDAIPPPEHPPPSEQPVRGWVMDTSCIRFTYSSTLRPDDIVETDADGEPELSRPSLTASGGRV